MPKAKEQIIWLDTQDAGFRLFIDDQNRLVLDETNSPASKDVRQILAGLGFEPTPSGFAGQFTALTAYGLSRLPGAKLVEMDREKIDVGYREVLLKNTQAFVQDLVENGEHIDTETANEGIDDFLDDLAGAEPNEAAPDVPEEPEPETENQVQAEDPAPILAVHDVAVFNPHKKTLRTDIGMVSEVIRSTTNRIGYHIVVQDDDGPRSQRVWENDYDIQAINAGFSWESPGKQKEVVEKEDSPETGIVFQVVVTDTSTLTHTFETIKAEDIGAIIQADQAALEAQGNDAGPTEDESLSDEIFDAFLNDIPEPRKSRVSKQLLSTDNDTGRPRKAIIDERIAQGFVIATNEENNRKKRGLISPDGQFMDGFTKTELDYAAYLVSLSSKASVTAETDAKDINALRETARELGLEKEADALWLNQDIAGLEKLIADNSKPVDQENTDTPWGPDEQYRILGDIKFRTPLQAESEAMTQGHRVLLKDYPGFEFVAHSDRVDSKDIVFSEYRTGMRVATADDGSMDSAIQKGLAALKANTPDPARLRDIVEGKQINNIPENTENYGVIPFGDPREETLVEASSEYVLTDISFKDIDRISSVDLLALIRTENLEAQGYKVTLGDLMTEVSKRMTAGTLLKDLGWPDDPEAVYVNRETGEKKEFQILGHGYSFFEKFDPEGLENKPAEGDSQDVSDSQPTFDEQKQELRREYFDRGYSLYFKISDESWNLTHQETRTVGQTEFMAGDIALSLEKEAFLDVESCINRFETFFSEETNQPMADESEPVPAYPMPDFSSISEAMYNKRMNLPSNETLWYTVQKSEGQTYTVTIGRHDDSSISRIYGKGDTIEAAYKRAASSLKPSELNPGQPAENMPDPTPEPKSNPAILPYKEQFGSGAAKNIGKLLNDLGIAQEVANSKDYYARIENEPYMDLIIEKHSDELFLTHYYEQNGDLIMDNELVFTVNEETGHLVFKEVALQNPRGGEKRVHDKGFANMFAKNIVKQGFGQGKILHTTMSEAKQMQEDEKQADVADEANQNDMPEKRPYYEFKNETWQDYEPGQLPYYELGGKAIDVDDIEPYDFQKDEDGNVSMTNFFPGKVPLDPQEIFEKLTRYRATEEKNLDLYISKYKDLVEKGIEAVSEEDRQDMTDDKAVATALFLEHSHIAYSKGYIAAIDAVFIEMEARQDASVHQQENLAPVPEKIAVTDKSVDGNPQRAVLKDNEIEIMNKSGRKIVSRKTFPLSKWESLSTSFGNPGYNKREFVKSLGLVKDDGSPESHSLKERIIDSQVMAVDTVYKEFCANQKPVIEQPVDEAFDPTTPEGYAKVMSDTELQEEYQDALDSCFNSRIIDIRNALRDMGWEGEQYKDLYKYGEPLKVEPIPVKSGANIIGFTVNGVRDDLTKTPEQFAKKIDETHNLNFYEAANEGWVGANQDGFEIHQTDDGNRYLIKDGVKTSAPMVLSPDRTLKPYSPEELFQRGKTQFLTPDEIKGFKNPGLGVKSDFPSVAEIPADITPYFSGTEINLRMVLMKGGLPDDPEKLIPLIERKKHLTEKGLESDIQKYEQILSGPEPNQIILNQIKASITESKGRLEALSMALEEQNQLLDDQQTIKM
jgi:hypothetical protein